MHSGQLAFVNGGFSSHDEACPSFQDMIANFMVGGQFIAKEFGSEALPRAGWHIDAFGHSLTNAHLLAEVGMEANFFARIDDNEKDWRKRNKQLEFMWKPTNETEIFTHVFPGHYSSDEAVAYDNW